MPSDSFRLENEWTNLERQLETVNGTGMEMTAVSSMGIHSDLVCWNPMGALQATRSLRLYPEVERVVFEGNARRLLGLPATPDPDRGRRDLGPALSIFERNPPTASALAP